jgi:hypothetical protein
MTPLSNHCDKNDQLRSDLKPPLLPVIELAFQTYIVDHRRPNLASDSIDLYIIAMHIIVKVCNKI